MMFLSIITLFVLVFLYLDSLKNENSLNYKRVRVTNSNKALDILDIRFANGEISEDEYLKRRSLLK
ncbi:SHOCT domain-containing protein [Clostridium thermopalmarium]|uniref:SHOCT domain-containing protein n=1 Tax=Clostridium thermopalmarium DSM 5974 TaxID=1121340 RepID=A0A2T0AZK7_9CLOT|nr:SHOCT domain-containing protein [Clostridium thermopalmarium]PRR76633.1 hypothetical protein CPAL_03040 [Clostridium thermopalmarium DSM 5974]PVZ28254.1 putative membrane protein [Clostridium thermopalmarium DSM 5974]